MSEIRVTYSGLISLLISTITIATGLAFMLILTRTLLPEELGTWRLILSLLTYVVIAESIFSYWVTREIPRGIESAKSAITCSGIFSLGLGVIYLLAAYLISLNSDVNFDILIFGIILVPLMFIVNTLSAVNFAWKPQNASYGALIMESLKLPLALILIYYFNLGVQGVIIAFAASYAISIIGLAYFSRNKIKYDFKISHLKKWLKLSWLPLYPGLSALLLILDVVIFTVITGSVYGLAFYAAALTIGRLVAISGNVSRATYPKLLEDHDKKSYLGSNFTLVLYFTIPLAALSIIFAKPGLYLLNPIYASADFIVILIVIKSIFVLFCDVFFRYILGDEKVDVNEKSTFRDYFRSKLFVLPTMKLLTFVSYLVILVVALLLLKTTQMSDIDLVVWWSIIAIIPQIPFTLYLYYTARKKLQLKFESSLIIKYILIGVGVFVPLFFVITNYLEYNENVFQFIPHLVLFSLMGIIPYFVITYMLDKRIKNLTNLVLKELKQIGRKNNK